MLSTLLLFLLLDDPPKPVKDEPKPAETPQLGRTNAQSGEARRNENIFITAVDNNAQRESNIRLGTTATPIQEINASSRYFGAEYGVAPSSLFHLPSARAGQAIHGVLQWTHGNSVFAARSFFQAGGVKPAHDNVFTLRVGVPFGKLWNVSFDGNVQPTRGYVNGNILIPKPEERTCLSPDPRVCAVINRWFRAWPNAVPNRPDINERALNTNAAQAIDAQSASTRLDRLGKTHRLSLRHNWSTQTIDAFQFVNGQNPDTTLKSHDARLTHTWIVSPRMVLESTAGFTRNRTLLAVEPNAVGPQVQVGTAYTALGPTSSVPLDRVQNRYRLATRWQLTKGKHTLSAGGEIARLHFNGREDSSLRGNWYFRNDFGRDAITNFRLGAASRYSFAAGDLSRSFLRWEQFWFVDDTWKVNSKLNVKLGLRYQPQQGMREKYERSPTPVVCDCNNVGPSLGIGYQPGKRSGILRMHYTIQYGEIPAVTLTQTRWNAPNFLKSEAQSPDFMDPKAGIYLGTGARSIAHELPRDLLTPYSQQYSLIWQLPLPASMGKLDLGYVGSRTWKLLYLLYNNRAVPVAGIPQTTATINQRRPNPAFFDFRDIVNLPRAYFDAARVTYSLTMRNGFSLETSYWFSKAIDSGGTYVNVAAGDEANQMHAQTPGSLVSDLKAVSFFDQRHAFLNRLSWQTPVRNRWAKDWRFSTIFLAKSGLPFTVISGSDGPGGGNVDGVSGDRPNLIDPKVLGRTITSPDSSQTLLPRTAFANILPTDARGNLGINTFRRASFRNLNASVERRFLLPRESAIRFRADSLNALNTPQFAEPIFDLSNPAFGKITNTLNDGRAFKFTLAFEF